MIAHSGRWRGARLATACCAPLAALTIAATSATAAQTSNASAAQASRATTAQSGPAQSGPAQSGPAQSGPAQSGSAPLVATSNGVVRGAAVAGGYAFRGLPYAAPPVGKLRWRPPAPAASWHGVRDATSFGPSCPQGSPTFTLGPTSEDCLYLNVSAPTLRPGADRPVLVWIHGGGFTTGAGRDYDPAQLVADGAVVVTINYRLGALGFLAHPALASRPGGPAGNYGLMDQQAALRWVRANIGRFGGNPHNVTIAGQSAGGLAVLDHLVSPGSRGLFQRAIIESGSFALTQQPLATAEAAGQDFAVKAGCPDQTAACLRQLPVSALTQSFPAVAIPGVADGQVLPESVGTALAAGRFARVPVLNGTNHDEERFFVTLGLTVSGGTYVPIPGDGTVTPASYQTDISAVLGVSGTRAAAIAAQYPVTAYPSPAVAFSTLVGDANFACPALQIDRWTAARVPTFAYEFNDDNAPARYVPTIPPPVATHQSELQYLFGLPGTIPATLTASQQALAASMQAAWVKFAASGQPGSAAVPWPAVGGGATRMVSLVPPEPQAETDFPARHHCGFWAAG
ncbi:MAG TPA: carboxylesterase family protein [Streptosporangiaceae bacterium]